MCMSVGVSQSGKASRAAEITCVIRVNGVQSLALYSPDQSSQPGIVFVCVSSESSAPSQNSHHKAEARTQTEYQTLKVWE